MTEKDSIFGEIFERAMDPDAQLLRNKIHAEDIHIQQETPEHLRPRFSPHNREAARRHAHDVILDTLKLLTENDPDETSDQSLITAATSLEKIYLRSSPDAPEKVQELYNAALAYYLAGQYARAFVGSGEVLTDGVFAICIISDRMRPIYTLYKSRKCAFASCENRSSVNGTPLPIRDYAIC